MYQADNLSIGKRGMVTVAKLLTLAASGFAKKKCGSGRGGGNLVRCSGGGEPLAVPDPQEKSFGLRHLAVQWMNSTKCLVFL